ncbi:Glu-tRNA(Gln) amidotransferase subunit GatE [Candidatus Woesearchaeota archaeon]|nr:Glu-tRNA(Gln) amidotransferase subunit GatE [Candidatus Woesearchaeota archaeon]
MKCGLEIHQQLNTKKLFCDCNSIIIDDKPDFFLKRKLRTSASELGEIDKAALHESQKNKYFIYEGYHDSNCLICIDEEPPLELNKKALNIALQVSLLLNAKPVDEIQVMRKVVIDGSNITGFQRTALIATDGYIETSEGKIKIETICLEEEAAKKKKDTQDYSIYNISRLGIPLIEIATGPEIKSNESAKEVAVKIGMVLRSVGSLRRGIGSIRQDVNVSFNGPRVEIKGFQDLQSIPKIIKFEEERQKEEGIKEPHVRKAEKDFTTTFLRPMPGSARMYPETDIPTIKISKTLLDSLELPVLIDKKVENLEENYNLQAELARELVKNKINFKDYVKLYPGLETNFIARVLIEIPKEIKSRFKLDSNELKEKEFKEVLQLLNENKLRKENTIDCLVQLLKSGKIRLEEFKRVSDKELEETIRELIKKNPKLSPGAIIGDLMKKFNGKVDGKKASEIIKKLL